LGDKPEKLKGERWVGCMKENRRRFIHDDIVPLNPMFQGVFLQELITLVGRKNHATFANLGGGLSVF